MTVAMIFFLTGSAMAITFGGSVEQQIQEILDDLVVDGVSDVKVTDYIADEHDSTWQIGATGAITATMVIELGAASFNEFGIYQGTQYVRLFAGSDSAGAQTGVSLEADGSVHVKSSDTGIDFIGNSFGFYIHTRSGWFHSDTKDNCDGFDHMAAYQGIGEQVQLPFSSDQWEWGSEKYILAWEGLKDGGDSDYQDMVVMVEFVQSVPVLVESVKPVPEPTTLILFGSGLLGLCVYARKR